MKGQFDKGFDDQFLEENYKINQYFYRNVKTSGIIRCETIQ